MEKTLYGSVLKLYLLRLQVVKITLVENCFPSCWSTNF